MDKQPAYYGAFQNSFIDFDHGIRVGHLSPEERITQIIKARLSGRHSIDFVCDRWGRGVYWQWICWVPKPNREAKPHSSGFNFASAKFFIAVDRDDRVFQSGIQIERAPKRPGPDDHGVRLAPDWDWHILLKALGQTALPRAISRLLREGFRVRAGAFSALAEYRRKDWDVEACRRRMQRFAPGEWGGFQLFWPMPEKEVRSSSGMELVQATLAVFEALTPAINLCMYAPCLTERKPRD